MDNKEIGNIRLKFSCDADWEKMEVVNGARYCDHCSKVVYDFTNTKQQEFLKILAENNNNVCGRFTSAQMAPVRAIPYWRKWASAAVVLLGINILNNKAQAQQSVKIHKQANARQPDIVSGEIVSAQAAVTVTPEFPGGIKAWNAFLSNNLHYRKGMIDGRVFIQFDVMPTGQLENFKVVKKLSGKNDAEVLRVLKLSPKWKPGTVNGRPASIKYMIPVNFQL